MTPRKVYDPGGEHEYERYEELDCIVLCVDAVMAATDVLQTRPAAFREGEFTINGVVSKMFSVLWDGGACHRSNNIEISGRVPFPHFCLLYG